MDSISIQPSKLPIVTHLQRLVFQCDFVILIDLSTSDARASDIFDNENPGKTFQTLQVDAWLVLDCCGQHKTFWKARHLDWFWLYVVAMNFVMLFPISHVEQKE
ncbi:unnamed protein product [Vicia faba]|uniref:Uncharacterized protein n=1 Tax=Vicia faba TaxID=3906 RepID=A0AAV0Z8H1_VICFA|nr:unnamed protein product [Vicia faba]